MTVVSIFNNFLSVLKRCELIATFDSLPISLWRTRLPRRLERVVMLQEACGRF